MINLMKGDCLEVMKGIPDGSVDMILTDPPYGMALTPQRKSGKFHGEKIKNDDTLAWCDQFFSECYRVTAKVSSAFFFCNHHCVSEFIASAKKAGYEIKNLVVWDKGHFGMGGNWRPVHELVLICTKGRFVTKSNNLRTIVSEKKVHHSKAVHPTEKPVALLEHFIDEVEMNPQAILDPFMGSGTTGVAAKNLNRSFIGIELDDNYFEIAKRRIEG
ncbi:DNA methylase [Vibrio phage 1.005.O._10N.286.48.F2]|nr:DNA methylase [Vibrio phage 1.005.O._10N.286.48.F2]